MSIIRQHDFTLNGGTDKYKIVLRPLLDEHLPLLCKWNSDPDVLYWSEGSDVNEYDPETVSKIYGSVSQKAFCFLVEAGGVPVGECWLQKMNLQPILDRYTNGEDVRRIDMMIGNKDYWNLGIGSAIIGMLLDFAFTIQGVDYLYGLVFDYNIRSQRTFEKNGFTLHFKEPSTQAPDKAKEDFYYRMSYDEYGRLKR